MKGEHIYTVFIQSCIITSSREMSSFEKQSPGIMPRFFNQKMAQKLPLKKIPSTAAKATIRSANDARSLLHHLSALDAFFCTQGTVSMAFSR